MTIRRDLTALERQGMLHKVHGGAVLHTEPSTSEPGFEAKSRRRLAEKEAIAARAATMVAPGSAIAISAGTTTHLFARHLVDIPGLTVVTNSVWVADVLHRSGSESLSVLLTGGLRTPSDALVGPIAIAALRSLHLDAVFMGVHGMDLYAGFSTPNLLEAETNRAMVRSARRLAIDAHMKAPGRSWRSRPHDQMQITGVEAVRDPPVACVQYKGLLLHRPIPRQRPLIEPQLCWDRIDAPLVPSRTTRRGKVLSAPIADIGFQGL